MKQALLRVVLETEKICKKIVAEEEWEAVNRVLVLEESVYVPPVELLHLTRQEYPATK
ncbi:MAG: hypothetical protein IMF01_01780 [Proteobacteria bacterium]|jgi:hypothetical protein|nr:hypothetical protein [Pseudomonadota bacterium]